MAVFDKENLESIVWGTPIKLFAPIDEEIEK